MTTNKYFAVALLQLFDDECKQITVYRAVVKKAEVKCR